MKKMHLIVNQRRVGVITLVADNVLERLRGLLGRESLASDEALLLPGCGSIHTFGMRFSIDVLFLDRYQRVVALHTAVPSRRMLLSLRAKQTLEMSSGAARMLRLSVGDQLAFEALL